MWFFIKVTKSTQLSHGNHQIRIQIGINTFYDIYPHIHLSSKMCHQELYLNGHGEIGVNKDHCKGKFYKPTIANCYMHKTITDTPNGFLS